MIFAEDGIYSAKRTRTHNTLTESDKLGARSVSSTKEKKIENKFTEFVCNLP